MHEYNVELCIFSENKQGSEITQASKEVLRSMAARLEMNCLAGYYNRRIVVSDTNGGHGDENSGCLHTSFH